MKKVQKSNKASEIGVKSEHLTQDELYGFAQETVVKKYQEKYVRYFDKGPVLDLGSGRGIFLEILKKHGIKGVGVDASKESVKIAEEKGLVVFHGNVHRILNKHLQKKQLYNGIFCSHLVEHLSYDEVKLLFNLCYQVLKRDGVFVIITPNPQDIRVMTEIFWLDQTHVRPYPLLLLNKMLTQIGFEVIEQGIDPDTILRHFKNPLIDKISKRIFAKIPLGRYFNTGHDIYMVVKKS